MLIEELSCILIIEELSFILLIEELFALVLLVRNLDHNTQVVYVTDNYNVFSIYNKGKESAKNSANCDLYKEVFDAIRIKQIQLEVRWMPSHEGLEDNAQRPEGVSHFDVLANDQADILAKKAAKRVAIPIGVARNHIYYVELVVKIQKRLATILLNLPHRQINKPEKATAIPRKKLEDLLKDTSHNVVASGMRLSCHNCLNSFRSDDPGCKHWLTTMCVPERSSQVESQLLHAPVQIQMPIHVGNQVSHSTHSLKSYRGLIYCSKCGSKAGDNQIRYLAKACEPPTYSGRRTLARIENGRLPPGITEWPK